MKTKIEMGSFNIKRSDLVIEIPSIKIEADYEVKEMGEMYDLSKKVIAEMPGIMEKFFMEMIDSFEKVEVRIQEREERDIINSVKGVV